jgi:hypothetical protein
MAATGSLYQRAKLRSGLADRAPPLGDLNALVESRETDST